MDFKSRRLRVQLPCRESESLIELDDERLKTIVRTRQITPTLCRYPTFITCYKYQTPPEPCFKFLTPPITCVPYRTHICHFRTPPVCVTTPVEREVPDPTIYELPIDVDPLQEETILIRPEQLPEFRRQLEAELDEIEAMVLHKDELEGQLKELDSVEEQLRERSG